MLGKTKHRIALLTGGLLCLALTGVTAEPQEGASGQSLTFGEVIDVRLVNLEIVVTDREGNRVAELLPEDFRLLIDDEEVPIEFFTEVRNGVAMAEEGVPEGMEFMPGTSAGEALSSAGATPCRHRMFGRDCDSNARQYPIPIRPLYSDHADPPLTQ